MNERVKELRKCLGLSQEEFGKRLGFQKSQVSRLESGLNNVTDQTQILICREFNVSEKWLRIGEGDMFVMLPPEDEYVRAAAEIAKDDGEEIIRKIIIEYWKLNPEGKKHLKEYIINISNSIKKEE